MSFDGKSYYCSQCGKAGFKSEMAVRGHRSACGGRAGVLGAIDGLNLSTSTSTSTSSELSSITSASPSTTQVPSKLVAGSGLAAAAHDCSECSRLRLELSRERGRSESAVRLASNHLPHLAMTSAEGEGVLGWVRKTWRDPAGRALLLVGSVFSFALLYELIKSSDVEERKGIRSKVVNRSVEGILKRFFG